MTEPASFKLFKPEIQAWFEAWRSCAQDVLSQVTSQANVIELAAEPFAADDSDLRYTITAAGAVQGEMALRLSQRSGLTLARKLLGETTPVEVQGEVQGEAQGPTMISDENREAMEELLRQISGLAATTVGAQIGGSVSFQLAPAEAPWAGAADYAVVLRHPSDAMALDLRLSPALAAAISARAESKAAVESKPAAPSPSSPSTSPPPQAIDSTPLGPPQSAQNPIPSGPSGDRYRRLLDVGLGVKLRFGTRSMMLRDVLALSSGLVVELDNELNSPVDLLLDGRVIARGEVVVIDGKYGLRVGEVVDSSLPPSASGS
jgi:flagellar motor switch protein FliN/FliY